MAELPMTKPADESADISRVRIGSEDHWDKKRWGGESLNENTLG